MGFCEFKGDLLVKVDRLAGDPEVATREFLDRLKMELFRDLVDLQVIERIRKTGAKVAKIDLVIGPAD